MCFTPEPPGGLQTGGTKTPEVSTGLLPASQLAAIAGPAFESGPDKVPLPVSILPTGGIRLGAVVPPFQTGFLKGSEGAQGLDPVNPTPVEPLPPEGLNGLEPCLV